MNVRQIAAVQLLCVIGGSFGGTGGLTNVQEIAEQAEMREEGRCADDQFYLVHVFCCYLSRRLSSRATAPVITRNRSARSLGLVLRG